MYELDVRSICPQPAGHARPPARGLSSQGAGRRTSGRNDVAGIHDRVVFKQAGLDKRLQYDAIRARA